MIVGCRIMPMRVGMFAHDGEFVNVIVMTVIVTVCVLVLDRIVRMLVPMNLG